MLFLSVENFFQEAQNSPRLSRDEEIQLALQMKNGDTEARQRIIHSHYPLVASYIRRMPKDLQTLKVLYRFLQSLEAGVDSFNFQQDGEAFLHHLSWRMRQCLTRCIADRP